MIRSHVNYYNLREIMFFKQVKYNGKILIIKFVKRSKFVELSEQLTETIDVHISLWWRLNFDNKTIVNDVAKCWFLLTISLLYLCFSFFFVCVVFVLLVFVFVYLFVFIFW